VQVAAICENTLEEKDNVISAIRIVDKFTIEEPTEISEGETAALPLKVLVMLKSGSVRGEKDVLIVMEKPSGKRANAARAKVVFGGDETGVNLRATIPVPLSGEGVYWLDVLVEETVLTRIPFRIAYSKKPTTPDGQPPAPASEPTS
jgi:hypothetical protein